MLLLFKDDDCLDDFRAIKDEACLSPVKCKCNEPYGGIDCSLDLSRPPPISLDKRCCDLRNEDCDVINGFGFPFSKRDQLYAKVDFIEVFKNEYLIDKK